jgi:hypothetical protein
MCRWHGYGCIWVCWYDTQSNSFTASAHNTATRSLSLLRLQVLVINNAVAIASVDLYYTAQIDAGQLLFQDDDDSFSLIDDDNDSPVRSPNNGMASYMMDTHTHTEREREREKR